MVSFGGTVDGALSASVEITDIGPEDNLNCKIPDLPEPVRGHCTVKTEIGIISCGGGTNKCHRLASNNSWISFPPMNERPSYCAMEEGNGKLFAVVGHDDMEWIDLRKGTTWIREKLPFYINIPGQYL